MIEFSGRQASVVVVEASVVGVVVVVSVVVLGALEQETVAKISTADKKMDLWEELGRRMDMARQYPLEGESVGEQMSQWPDSFQKRSSDRQTGSGFLFRIREALIGLFWTRLRGFLDSEELLPKGQSQGESRPEKLVVSAQSEAIGHSGNVVDCPGQIVGIVYSV